VGRAQAAVVAATTLAMSSPAFAATIKLGGDNGELGFFVRARRRDARRARRRRRDARAVIPGEEIRTSRGGSVVNHDSSWEMMMTRIIPTRRETTKGAEGLTTG
jgi:hypothetical protein